MTVPRARRPPGWLLDEAASAGRENLDASHVARYDAKEDAAAADEVAMLRRWGLNEASTVVDIGAGTGQLRLAVAPACARVVAVDVSPPMLRALQGAVDAAGLPNVEVVEAGFLTYAHQGPVADVVYSRYALHHLPDAWKAVALARTRDMLRPGGILRRWDAVYHVEPSAAEDLFDTWCATGTPDDAVATTWTRPEIEEHIRDEHSTFTWLLEPMIERCGFRLAECDRSTDGLFTKYIAVAV